MTRITMESETHVSQDTCAKTKNTRRPKLKNYKCEFCSLYCASPAQLRIHIARHTKEKNFKCQLCHKQFITKSSLDLHINIVHTKERTYMCEFPKCGKVFSYYPYTHQKSHEIDRKNDFQCRQCDGKGFLTKQRLNEHINAIHTKRKSYTCRFPNCEKSFLRPTGLNSHERTHGPKVKCGECAKLFSSKSSLYGHINAVHTKENTFPCKFENCGKKYFRPEGLKEHLMRHHSNQEKPFKCEKCDKRFLALRYLNTHINAVHTKQMQYPCIVPNCGKIFYYSSALKRHTEVLHQAEGPDEHAMLPCPICKLKFKKFSLGPHIKRHTQKKKFQCDKCSYVCQIESLLKIHKKTHLPRVERVLFPCEFCDRKLASKAGMLEHVDRVHSKKKFDCTFCDRKISTRGALKAHLRTHTGETPYPCKQCDKSYSSSSSLLSHIKTVHKRKREFNCSHCSKKFKFEFELTRHLTIHEGKKFPCPSCDVVLATSTGLLNHSKIHGDTGKNHKCFQCKRCFLTKDELDLHSLKHSAKLIHACSKCDKVFSSAIYANAHMTTEHLNKTHVCSSCNRAFSELHSLQRHVKFQHTSREERHRCQFCDKIFSSADHLKIHTLRHTKENPFFCKDCPQLKFKFKKHLTQHKQKYHNSSESRVSGSDSTNLGFDNSKKSKKMVSTLYNFKYQICRKSFTMKKVFEENNKAHGLRLKFNCRQCVIILERLQ